MANDALKILRLSAAESDVKLRSLGWHHESEELFHANGLVKRVEAIFDGNGRGIACLCEILQLASPTSGILLRFDEYGIWATEEMPFVWKSLNGTVLGDLPLATHPGLLLEEGSTGAALEIFRFAVTCGWGGVMAASHAEAGLAFSHDNLFIVYGTWADAVESWWWRVPEARNWFRPISGQWGDAE